MCLSVVFVCVVGCRLVALLFGCVREVLFVCVVAPLCVCSFCVFECCVRLKCELLVGSFVRSFGFLCCVFGCCGGVALCCLLVGLSIVCLLI